ncbi:MAG: YlqD family protein [Desulfotomaculaceae bacterium]|nr:YlqD family protein [Desulfotomaculaceae bacterium]
MEKLTLIRPVLVKVIVTDNYKKAAVAELQNALHRIDVDLQRLEFHEKRLASEIEKKSQHTPQVSGQQIAQERQRLVETRGQLVDRVKNVGQLELGSEVVYGKMESPVEIKVGDDWRRVLGVEIVLQDGIITTIRER